MSTVSTLRKIVHAAVFHNELNLDPQNTSELWDFLTYLAKKLRPVDEQDGYVLTFVVKRFGKMF